MVCLRKRKASIAETKQMTGIPGEDSLEKTGKEVRLAFIGQRLELGNYSKCNEKPLMGFKQGSDLI